MEPNDEPSWRTIWHRFEREEDTIAKAISALQSELGEFKYHEPGEILHIFGIMLMMSDAELIPADRENVVENAKAYIVSLRDKGLLPPIDSDSFSEDIRHGAWGGLRFSESGTPHLGEIHSFLAEQRARARLERLPELAERLQKELDVDPDLFCRRLIGAGGEQSDLIDGPVLKEIDPNLFLEAILRQPAAVQYQVFGCLRSRHSGGGFARGLEEERAWLKDFHKAMLVLAEASEPIRRNKLKIFASWIGKNVHDVTEGNQEKAEQAD